MIFKIFLYFCYGVVVFHALNLFVKQEPPEPKKKLAILFIVVVYWATITSHYVVAFHIGYKMVRLLELIK